jgi:hypothetical protein
MARKKKKKNSGSKAISINLARAAYVLGVLGYATQGMSLSASRDNLTMPLENLRQNLWLLPAGVVVALLTRALGRFSPSFGIKKAFNIKAF